MAVSWTLLHVASDITRELGGDPHDTSASGGWGFHVARRNLLSLRADTVELLVVPDAFDEDAPGTHNPGNWSNGDQVEIYRGEERWFAGRLDGEKRSASGPDHTLAWNVVGPWQGLEELQYLQVWGTTAEDGGDPPEAVVSQVERGDVVLMQRYTGSGSAVAIKTGEQVFDLLEFAARRTGAPPTFQFPGGPGSPDQWTFAGIDVDFVEVRDQTVANLIRRLLEWHPRAVSWFNYSTTPPTLNISETDFETVDIDRGDLDQTQIVISPNDELDPPYVKISYKTVNQVDVDSGSSSYIGISTDVHPAGLDSPGQADHRKAVRATVGLEGSQRSIQQQRVRTRSIPESKSDDVDRPQDHESNVDPADRPFAFDAAWERSVLEFWANDDRVGWLADLVPENEDIADHVGMSTKSPHVVLQPEVLDADAFPSGEEDPTYDLWDTPRALDRGSTVDEWMNVKTQRVKCKCRLVWKGPKAKKGNVIRKLFPKTDPNSGLPLLEASVTVTATNAISKTYSRTTGATLAEEPPVGIAKKLYDDMSVLKYMGHVRLEADDLPALAAETGLSLYRPGQLLNITNSNHSAWGTFEAQVQGVAEDVRSGTAAITVGAPKQLGLQNFVTLARLWSRNPPGYTTQAERETGEAPGAGNTTGGEHGPKDAAAIQPGRTKIPFTVTIEGMATDPTQQVFIEPGWVTVDRKNDGVTRRLELMPHIGGQALDGSDDPDGKPPSLVAAISKLYLVYFEYNHVIDDNDVEDGQVKDVEVKIIEGDEGALPPDNMANLGGNEFRAIATLDTASVPNIIKPIVEGSFYHPRKKEAMPPNTGSGYIPPFHPIRVGVNSVRFQPGVAVGTLYKPGPETDLGNQDPDEMWHEFPVFIGNNTLDHPNSTLATNNNGVSEYWMRVDQYDKVTVTGDTAKWLNDVFAEVWWFRVSDVPNFPICSLMKSVQPGVHPEDNELVKHIPIARVDTRQEPWVITSVWHGAVDIRRPPVLNIGEPT